MYINTKFNKLKPFFLINIILLTAVITIGSFYPVITGVVISFFGFNDWLALYFTALILFVLYFFEMKSIIINKEILGFILFLFLGPLFWKIDRSDHKPHYSWNNFYIHYFANSNLF